MNEVVFPQYIVDWMEGLAKISLKYKEAFENSRLNRDWLPSRLIKAHASLMSEMAAAQFLNVYFDPRVDHSMIGTPDLIWNNLTIDVKNTLYKGPTPKLIVSKEHDEHPNRFDAFLLMRGSADLTTWWFGGYAWSEEILVPSRLDHSLPWPAYSMPEDQLHKAMPGGVAI